MNSLRNRVHKVMRHVPHNLPRFILGGIFLFSGVNAFLQFAPMPSFNAAAENYLRGLFTPGGGFMYITVMSLEIVGGLLVISGRYVPLGLVVLVPILVNILLFHLFLDIKGIAPALVCCLCAGYLGGVRYRSTFAGLWQRQPR